MFTIHILQRKSAFIFKSIQQNNRLAKFHLCGKNWATKSVLLKLSFESFLFLYVDLLINHAFCYLRNLFLLFILKNCMQEIVSQIMTRHVVTINSSRSALDAALLMKENRISSLIVQDKDNKSLGIITERDFVKRVCAEDKKSSEVRISELMSKIQTFAEPDTPVDVAVQRMINNRIRRLPVMSDGNVVGIITVTDLAKELRRLMLTKGIVELID
jgi:CBS domain-containing protein